MFGVNERMDLKLFGHEIIFEESQPMWSWYLNVTDRRTDDLLSHHRAVNINCTEKNRTNLWHSRLKSNSTSLHNSVIICSMSATVKTSGKVKTQSRSIMQCFWTFSVKRIPLQQFWLLTEPMSSFFGGGLFWGMKGQNLRPMSRVQEGTANSYPPAKGSGECCKLPQRGLGQIHFGPTKSLENVFSGCKWRTPFNFLLSTGGPTEPLEYHSRNP